MGDDASGRGLVGTSGSFLTVDSFPCDDIVETWFETRERMKGERKLKKKESLKTQKTKWKTLARDDISDAAVSWQIIRHKLDHTKLQSQASPTRLANFQHFQPSRAQPQAKTGAGKSAKAFWQLSNHESDKANSKLNAPKSEWTNRRR